MIKRGGARLLGAMAIGKVLPSAHSVWAETPSDGENYALLLQSAELNEYSERYGCDVSYMRHMPETSPMACNSMAHKLWECMNELAGAINQRTLREQSRENNSSLKQKTIRRVCRAPTSSRHQTIPKR